LKKEIIKLLKEDEEFRYTVAGLIGLSEVLKRLDRIEEEQKKLREDFNSLREDFKSLRQDFNSLREDFVSLRKDFNSLREDFVSLRGDFVSLRKDFNSMLAEIRSINIRLGRLERTVEKITLDIEEEARAFIKHHLEQAGIKVELDALKLPEAEINIYGCGADWCVVGEASLRAGKKLADELVEKYKLLREKYPGYLRKNVILVLYVAVPTPDLIRDAEAKGIWLLKATKEYVPLKKVLEGKKN